MHNHELIVTALKELVLFLEEMPDEKKERAFGKMPPDLIAELDQVRAALREMRRV